MTQVSVDRGAGDAEYLAEVVGVDSFAFEFLSPGSGRESRHREQHRVTDPEAGILGSGSTAVHPWRDGTSRTPESIVRSGLVAPSGAAPGPAVGTTSALRHR
jgi:hypothetical protein